MGLARRLHGRSLVTVCAMLRAIGNVLWFLLAGIWLALGYAVAGLVMCITIIGIPFGIQAFKLAGFVLWPFGRFVAPIDALPPGSSVTYTVPVDPTSR